MILGVQTPNCIRHTVFDAVELDYKSVTVIVDATAAATPNVHAGMQYAYYLSIDYHFPYLYCNAFLKKKSFYI